MQPLDPSMKKYIRPQSCPVVRKRRAASGSWVESHGRNNRQGHISLKMSPCLHNKVFNTIPSRQPKLRSMSYVRFASDSGFQTGCKVRTQLTQVNQKLFPIEFRSGPWILNILWPKEPKLSLFSAIAIAIRRHAAQPRPKR